MSRRCDCGRWKRSYFDSCYRCWLNALPPEERERRLELRRQQNTAMLNSDPQHIEAMARLAELPPLPTVLPGHGACVDCQQPIDQGVTRCPTCRLNRLDGLTPATHPEPPASPLTPERSFRSISERENGSRQVRKTRPVKSCVDCGAFVARGFLRCKDCYLLRGAKALGG